MSQDHLNGSDHEHRVFLGVPGLDRILDRGIRPGSLIVIVGPPGAGKTLLAMQLLQEMHVPGVHPRAPKSLFLTADQSEDVLREEGPKILPSKNDAQHIGELPTILPLASMAEPTTSAFDDKVQADANAEHIAIDESELEFVFQKEEVQRTVRIASMKSLVRGMKLLYRHGARDAIPDTTKSEQPSAFFGLAVDGALNLPELRGAHPDERRNALLFLARCMRGLVRPTRINLHTAAILTVEATSDSLPPALEEYLADIVIHLTIDVPMKGKRRRLLEVRKSRYAGSVPGEHSLWIMSDDEVTRRYESNETLGWSRSVLEGSIRRGIVVFPRMRWRARRAPGDWEEFHHELLHWRRSISIHPEAREWLTRPESARILATLMRGPTPSNQDLLDAKAYLQPVLPLIADLILSDPNGQKLLTKLNGLSDAARAGDGISSKSLCSFGIRGLDSLFGSDYRVAEEGIRRLSCTAIIGGPGTGKSTLAYSFTLRGLIEGENVIFISFDERNRRILQQGWGLVVEQAGAGGRSRRFSEVVAEQILRMDVPNSGAKLCLIYEHPINTDLNELMHLLGREVEHISQTTRRPTRLVFDGFSELGRNIGDPLVFNNLTAGLINCASDWKVTLLLTCEDPRISQGSELLAAHLADNVIALRHVQVNNAARKSIWIEKARGRQHSSAVAELVFWNDGPETGVLVQKGFEGMSKVLSGHPQPAQIELRLFHENEVEKRCNENFVSDVQERFGDRVRQVPFSISGARRTYWHRQEGRDIRPDADVTVMALDEPWVLGFGEPQGADGATLAAWDPTQADVGQRFLVSQLMPRLCEPASIGGSSKQLRKMRALPHYFDLGLLLERQDRDVNLPNPPTHWERQQAEVEDPATDTSFETLVGDEARRLKRPGFAFNMESTETTACTFIEMCWNFGASQEFLYWQRQEDVDATVAAMKFLARLRWSDVLPYPCNLSDASNSLFARAWYANVPTLVQHAGDTQWKAIPFFTSGRHPPLTTDNKALVSDRLAEIVSRKAKSHIPPAAPNAEEQENEKHQHGYPTHQLRKSLAWQAAMSKAQAARVSEVEILRHHRVGFCCSGTWYLGVVSAGGNSNLGWSVVQEALNPRRIEERALNAGGFSPSVSFYHDHGRKPVPHISNMTFDDCATALFGRVRSRESALGFGITSDLPTGILSACREMPEILQCLVRNVLSNPRSDARHNAKEANAATRADAAEAFIRGEVGAALRNLNQLTGSRKRLDGQEDHEPDSDESPLGQST